MKQTCTLAAALLLTALSRAQGTSGQPDSLRSSLDPVTITSGLSAAQASATGRNLQVISGSDFARLPVRSLDELLRYVPGIEVQSRGPMGTQSDIVIRGGTFQQVLVILDGVRLNDPNTGHFSSYIPIAPDEIERIEVLKGAASAVYGSEAVGGVIHIITKTFAAGRDAAKQQLTASAGAGDYGLKTTQAGGYYQKGKTAIGGGLLHLQADGPQQRGTTGYLSNTTASLSVTRFIRPRWQVSLRSAWDRRRFSAQNYYTTFVSDTAAESVTTFWQQLRVAYTGDRNRLSLDAGYKEAADRYAFNSTGTANENRSRLLQSLITWEHRFSRQTTIVTGAQVQQKRIASNDRGNQSVGQAAAFLVLNQRAGKAFTASPALRIDWDERAGTEVVPQINLAYTAGRFGLRGSAGKTIRQADFTERFNNYNKPLVTGGSVGNPGLAAERSFSWEAGADYRTSRLRVSATLFRREATNVIDWATTPYAGMPRKDNLAPTGTFALASNIAAVTTSGLESDVQYIQPLRGEDKLWLNAGLVWLDRTSSGAAPSFYIASHARFLLNGSLRYSGRWFGIAVNGLYKERAPQAAASPLIAPTDAAYAVLNIKAEGYLLQRRLILFAAADNVLDRQYTDLLGAPMPGRWWSGGLRVALGQ